MERSNTLSTICRKIGSDFLDLLFPRLCLCCKEMGADKWFCVACWDLLALPDPAHRCRHCFALSERLLCSSCSRSPVLCFPRAVIFPHSLPAKILQKKMGEAKEALSAMALIFWHRLAYDLPDAVWLVPDERGIHPVAKLAREFANLLHLRCFSGIKKTYSGFLQPDLALVEKKIPTDQTLLLFDVASSLDWLKKASAVVSDAFPKKVFILSLFEG